MYCQKCGRKLNDDILFCDRCGTPTINQVLSQEAENKKNDKNNHRDHEVDSNHTKNRLNIKCVAMLLCTVLLLVVLSSVYYVKKNSRLPEQIIREESESGQVIETYRTDSDHMINSKNFNDNRLEEENSSYYDVLCRFISNKEYNNIEPIDLDAAFMGLHNFDNDDTAEVIISCENNGKIKHYFYTYDETWHYLGNIDSTDLNLFRSSRKKYNGVFSYDKLDDSEVCVYSEKSADGLVGQIIHTEESENVSVLKVFETLAPDLYSSLTVSDEYIIPRISLKESEDKYEDDIRELLELDKANNYVYSDDLNADYSIPLIYKDVGIYHDFNKYPIDIYTPKSLVDLNLFGCTTPENVFLTFPDEILFRFTANDDGTYDIHMTNENKEAGTAMTEIPSEAILGLDPIDTTLETDEQRHYMKIQIERIKNREQWPGTQETNPHNFMVEKGELKVKRLDVKAFLEALGYEDMSDSMFDPSIEQHYINKNNGFTISYEGGWTICFPLDDGRLCVIDEYLDPDFENLSFQYIAFWGTVMTSFNPQEVPYFNNYEVWIFDKYAFENSSQKYYYPIVYIWDDGTEHFGLEPFRQRRELASIMECKATLYDDFGDSELQYHSKIDAWYLGTY